MFTPTSEGLGSRFGAKVPSQIGFENDEKRDNVMLWH